MEGMDPLGAGLLFGPPPRHDKRGEGRRKVNLDSTSPRSSQSTYPRRPKPKVTSIRIGSTHMPDSVSPPVQDLSLKYCKQILKSSPIPLAARAASAALLAAQRSIGEISSEDFNEEMVKAASEVYRTPVRGRGRGLPLTANSPDGGSSGSVLRPGNQFRQGEGEERDDMELFGEDDAYRSSRLSVEEDPAELGEFEKEMAQYSLKLEVEAEEEGIDVHKSVDGTQSQVIADGTAGVLLEEAGDGSDDGEESIAVEPPRKRTKRTVLTAGRPEKTAQKNSDVESQENVFDEEDGCVGPQLPPNRSVTEKMGTLDVVMKSRENGANDEEDWVMPVSSKEKPKGKDTTEQGDIVVCGMRADIRFGNNAQNTKAEHEVTSDGNGDDETKANGGYLCEEENVRPQLSRNRSVTEKMATRDVVMKSRENGANDEEDWVMPVSSKEKPKGKDTTEQGDIVVCGMRADIRFGNNAQNTKAEHEVTSDGNGDDETKANGGYLCEEKKGQVMSEQRSTFKGIIAKKSKKKKMSEILKLQKSLEMARWTNAKAVREQSEVIAISDEESPTAINSKSVQRRSPRRFNLGSRVRMKGESGVSSEKGENGSALGKGKRRRRATGERIRTSGVQKVDTRAVGKVALGREELSSSVIKKERRISSRIAGRGRAERNDKGQQVALRGRIGGNEYEGVGTRAAKKIAMGREEVGKSIARKEIRKSVFKKESGVSSRRDGNGGVVAVHKRGGESAGDVYCSSRVERITTRAAKKGAEERGEVSQSACERELGVSTRRGGNGKGVWRGNRQQNTIEDGIGTIDFEGITTRAAKKVRVGREELKNLPVEKEDNFSSKQDLGGFSGASDIVSPVKKDKRQKAAAGNGIYKNERSVFTRAAKKLATGREKVSKSASKHTAKSQRDSWNSEASTETMGSVQKPWSKRKRVVLTGGNEKSYEGVQQDSHPYNDGNTSGDVSSDEEMDCEMSEAEWEFLEQGWVIQRRAERVGFEGLKVEEVKKLAGSHFGLGKEASTNIPELGKYVTGKNSDAPSHNAITHAIKEGERTDSDALSREAVQLRRRRRR